MLRPDERQHLLELLRPPAGCKLDVAVGTTFSLDLISALMLPLSFAFFDWEHVDGELIADPLALLEALRRYGDRFTIFCQTGQTRLPPKYPPLVTFLEPCIYDVEAPDAEGVFHPKVWALRFIADDGAVRYRVLCLSRNLTFDRCWDTVVALDGELTDRSNAIAANHPLADFVAALPGLARLPLKRERRQGVAKIADELRRVRFTWPEGFDENECRFWVAGLDGRTVAPFGARQDKALIVSPFISNSVVRDFLDHTDQTHLVSRPECLQELPQETLQRCKSVRFLAPELVDESDDDVPPGKDEVLDGLHAKLFVIDHGWDASIFSGSFNATVHALQHNVEFMVELVGKKSRFGVDQFLRQVKGETTFADLLQAYDVNAPSVPADATAQQLDDLLQATKRALAAAGPRLVVTAAGEKDLFDLSLEWERAPRWPSATVEIGAWPITQQPERGQTLGKSIVFPRLSYGGLTPLMAFSITAKIGEKERKSVFVMNLPLHGAPEDRQDRVVRSLIENRDQLLRYILFLLACGEEASASSGDLRRLIKSQEDGPDPWFAESLSAGNDAPCPSPRSGATCARGISIGGAPEAAGEFGTAQQRFPENLGTHLGCRPAGHGEMSMRPDTSSALAGLKDFQRKTVDYVFDRFYGPDSTRRFLVADEVGLGKTLVARGVIARTIDHLWNEVPRIDVIYICSNADIARQNIDRLRIPGCEEAAQATRLTLLPLQMHDLRRHRVNFVALTPATSFEQTAGGGRMDERVLLYWLLDRAWGIHASRASLYVMRDYARTASFKRGVKAFDFKKVNEQIADEFIASLAKQVQEEVAAGKPDMRTRFEELRGIFCRNDSKVPPDATKLRTRWIGELRRLLARVCLATLEPDLIILDEFQRFKHLLEEDSEAGELARDLFDSEAGKGARVLLLSATPYRGLSLHHETDDDHYGDFLALLGFLENGDAAGCKEILAEYRAALPAVMTPDGLTRLRTAKVALQQRLCRVMARTERLASSNNRGGMLLNAPPADASLHAVDVRAFLGAQRIADAVEQGDVVEYWKSAPYLFNFMDNYALKQGFKDAPEKDKMMSFVRAFPETFLDLERARAYQPLEPANPRLRELLSETVDRGMWRLLWMPPSLGYYTLEGPFAAPELASVTKRLVFSAWHMVPRAVASLVSYEAERRMMRAPHPRAHLTQEDWKKQRGLLRFGISDGRLTGLPVLLLVYPCLTFARDCDPRELARGARLTAAEVRSQFADRISGLIEKLGIVHETGSSTDDRWYWLAPMLLDFAEFPVAAQNWWDRTELAQTWAGIEAGDEDDGWISHVEQARQTLDSIRSGKEHLGTPPDDVIDVLALAASAAPATAAMRAYARASRSDPAMSLPLLDIAARSGRAFLSLFNHAEVIEAVRTEFRGEPYWQRVLEYAHAGGLQAVLDEYAHLLRESLSVAALSPSKIAEKIGAELIAALTIRAASLRIDEVTAPRYAREIKLKTEPMRIRFAMRFGDDRSDEEAPIGLDGAPAGTRKERVRAAFNSPFWPFVLVSTSVGQEGLDFHHYCHAITHWNLPSNPVDLEQREGRIHRYKGHAVRKNVAAAFAVEALRDGVMDAWETVFELGRTGRSVEENDLVPYWLFPGDAKIERHVPALPFSREVERLDGLRRALAIYRMVFGQSRQEDLITYLLAQIPENERERIVAELQIDLSPGQHARSHSQGA